MTSDVLQQMRKELTTDPYFGEGMEFVLGRLRDMRGRVVFDSGCGKGPVSVYFALQGATVIGMDCDADRVQQAVRLAETHGVQDRCRFMVGSSEEIPLRSGAVDVVFSRSTIQYMETDRVFKEYVRVLRSGGSIALVENLGCNPLVLLFRLHRRVTARTQAQRDYVASIKGYIKPREISQLGACFNEHGLRHTHLFRAATMFLVHALRRTPGRSLARRLDRLVSAVDRLLLAKLPILTRAAWFVGIYCGEKRADGEFRIHG